ncbi:hypothetical protein [Bacillus sp. WMMC1349]|uniref:hypothetical protein n=1 Tax=Bacillus sp. WMMC1349 TaxID=2736254 RepID=UPI001C1329BC|nr:hypothetical protein [Bacillus sp. WMMC1349]
MKYYNKPVKWVDKYYSDGKIKREVTRRTPALECKRNVEHWYEIDPAEDKINFINIIKIQYIRLIMQIA